jgi:homoserine dehydrogenase
MRLNILGFGSVGQAFVKILEYTLQQAKNGTTSDASADIIVRSFPEIHVYAPEIPTEHVSGNITFHPCAPVSRETLVSTLNAMTLQKGRI